MLTVGTVYRTKSGHNAQVVGQVNDNVYDVVVIYLAGTVRMRYTKDGKPAHKDMPEFELVTNSAVFVRPRLGLQ